jgi:anti-sigma factor RsiW
MDCAEARLHLHDLRRGRLPPGLHEEIRRHLDRCEACRRAEEAEGVLDELLLLKLPRRVAPEGLRQRLASASQAAAPVVRLRAPARWQRLVAPGLAACLALATTALIVERSTGHDAGAARRLEDEVVDDHLRVLASLRPLEVESGGSHQVKPWFEGRLDFAPVVPLPELADLKLRGGSIGYVWDRKAAVLQYSLRLHAVTLLAFRAEGLAWPPEDASVGGLRAHASASRGFAMVLWRAGGLGYALVSDIGPGELAEVAAAMAPATGR